MSADPRRPIRSEPMADEIRRTLQWDEGLKKDAERCARARGISVAEFIRQAITHYVAWTSRDLDPERKEPPA